MSVSNDIVTDQRIFRTCQVLQQEGFSVHVAGRRLKDSIPIANLPFRITRFKLHFNKGPLFYASLNLRLFFWFLFHKADLIYANDLDTLLAAWLAAKIKQKKIIYDSHEYFTEVPELQGRPFVKKMWERIERYILRRFSGPMITVNDSIAHIYAEKYTRKVEVLRNLPFFTAPQQPLKRKYFPADKPIIIYQGALNMGRGLEEMIEAMLYIDHALLAVFGDGDVSASLKTKVVKLNLENQVKFYGKKSPSVLRDYTREATVGISLERNIGLNYYYALPNKLFDYVQARIPVFVSDLPELRAIVSYYKIGEICAHNTPKEIAKQMNRFLAQDIKEVYSENLEKAAQELCWEIEKEKMVQIINKNARK